MSTRVERDIGAIFRDGVRIHGSLEAAARDAIRRHKQADQPVPVWRGGKTVFVPAEELEQRLNAETD